VQITQDPLQLQQEIVQPVQLRRDPEEEYFMLAV